MQSPSIDTLVPIPRAAGERPVWLRVGALLDGGSAPPLRDAHVVYNGNGILFAGADISGLSSYQVARRGIAIIPDTRRIIPNITVHENLKLAMLKTVQKNQEASLLEMAYTYFPRLKDRSGNPGAALSGGEQQMLAIARSLVASPKLMLIDEPTEGLMPTLVETIGDRLRELRETGLTMLLVETNLDVAFKVAQRVYVMEKGLIKFQGTKKELLESQEIQEKYLGVSV